MASKEKQKTVEQNGRVRATQDMTPAAAQQVIDAAKKASAERFHVEYQRLCAEYGLEIAGRPVYADDGRTVVVLFVRDADQLAR